MKSTLNCKEDFAEIRVQYGCKIIFVMQTNESIVETLKPMIRAKISRWIFQNIYLYDWLLKIIKKLFISKA